MLTEPVQDVLKETRDTLLTEYDKIKAEQTTLQELKEMAREYSQYTPLERKMVERIDELLIAWLPDLIYEELKCIRKNDDDNKEDDELQEFLAGDYHESYYKRSPLIRGLSELINNLYKD